jgi:hypothetical protein
MTKQQQQTGKYGQELAAAVLRGMGIEMVEQIGTPVLLIPADKGRQTYRVVYGEKVSGDHRGILRGGRSVLVETKTVLDRNLRWSDLRDHQPERLQQHHDLGGLSLLVWVHHTGVFVMAFPILGFGKGESIAPEMGMIADSMTRREIKELLEVGDF